MIRVRRGTIADFEQALRLACELREHETASGKTDAGPMARVLARALTDDQSFVAVLHNQESDWLEGFLAVTLAPLLGSDMKTGQVEGVFIREPFRRGGYGQGMWSLCASWAQELGVESFQFHVLRGNWIMRELLEKTEGIAEIATIYQCRGDVKWGRSSAPTASRDDRCSGGNAT